MTKAELVAYIAEQAEIKKAEAEAALGAVIESVVEQVCGGNSITLTGLGTFSMAERKARKGRNPQTGETMKIPASNTMKFKPAKAVRDKLNPPKKSGGKKMKRVKKNRFVNVYTGTASKATVSATSLGIRTDEDSSASAAVVESDCGLPTAPCFGRSGTMEVCAMAIITHQCVAGPTTANTS